MEGCPVNCGETRQSRQRELKMTIYTFLVHVVVITRSSDPSLLFERDSFYSVSSMASSGTSSCNAALNLSVPSSLCSIPSHAFFSLFYYYSGFDYCSEYTDSGLTSAGSYSCRPASASLMIMNLLLTDLHFTLVSRPPRTTSFFSKPTRPA
jgi:hypothetical protein